MSTESQEHPEEPIDADGLTDKQRRFIEEYPKDCNKAAAARRAGYSVECARESGYRLFTNVHIRAAIDARLKELAISGDEALKNVSDMATTRLNDFMVVREVQGYEMQEQYVTILLTHAKNRLKKLEQLIAKTPKKQKHIFEEDWANLQREILKHESDIEQHGDDVTRLVPWRPVIREEADLDLVAIARAHNEGRIKSYKHTKEGVSVEMYDALAANRDLLKIDGRFVDRTDITSGGQKLSGIQLVDFDGSPVQDV